MHKYFYPVEKSKRVTYSLFIISCCIMGVLLCVSAIFYLQYYVNSGAVPATLIGFGNAAVSILSAVQIVILNMLYSDLAIDLNNQENHR